MVYERKTKTRVGRQKHKFRYRDSTATNSSRMTKKKMRGKSVLKEEQEKRQKISNKTKKRKYNGGK